MKGEQKHKNIQRTQQNETTNCVHTRQSCKPKLKLELKIFHNRIYTIWYYYTISYLNFFGL